MSPPLPERAQAIIQPVREWCQKHPVQLCVLFGSQVTGKTHAQSDVDLALWPTHLPTPLTRLRWLREREIMLSQDTSLVLVSHLNSSSEHRKCN